MRTLVFAFATVFLACNGAFAQSHATPNLQIGKPPSFEGGGASARAFNIQNGMMWKRDLGWWTYRPETGTYFNPRTGVTCTGKGAAAACF
jgi:hypothetical protein